MRMPEVWTRLLMLAPPISNAKCSNSESRLSDEYVFTWHAFWLPTSMLVMFRPGDTHQSGALRTSHLKRATGKHEAGRYASSELDIDSTMRSSWRHAMTLALCEVTGRDMLQPMQLGGNTCALFGSRS
mgnify:FL=1